MDRPKVWASAFIILAIGLHAVPVLKRDWKKRAWPFLDWAMYKDSRPAGPIQAKKKHIVGVTAQGQRMAVTPILVGSSGFALQALYEQPMWAGDSSAARDLFRRLNRARQDPFVELRLESETYTVTDTGVARETNPTVIYRADSSPSR